MTLLTDKHSCVHVIISIALHNVYIHLSPALNPLVSSFQIHDQHQIMSLQSNIHNTYVSQPQLRHTQAHMSVLISYFHVICTCIFSIKK